MREIKVKFTGEEVMAAVKEDYKKFIKKDETFTFDISNILEALEPNYYASPAAYDSDRVEFCFDNDEHMEIVNKATDDVLGCYSQLELVLGEDYTIDNIKEWVDEDDLPWIAECKTLDDVHNHEAVEGYYEIEEYIWDCSVLADTFYNTFATAFEDLIFDKLDDVILEREKEWEKIQNAIWEEYEDDDDYSMTDFVYGIKGKRVSFSEVEYNIMIKVANKLKKEALPIICEKNLVNA
jgi:hypothetical protein